MALLAASAVAGAAHTGTTNETQVLAVALPPIGPNAGLFVRVRVSFASSANNKTTRIRVGSVSGATLASNTSSTTTAAVIEATIRNRGSSASQSCTWTTNRGTDALMQLNAANTAADLSVAQNLVVGAQLQSGAESMTIESYEVWLLP